MVPEGTVLEGGTALPPVNRLTDASENTTFPQLLLLAVKKIFQTVSQCEIKLHFLRQQPQIWQRVTSTWTEFFKYLI